LHGLACVHPCAFHGASVLDVPRALIFNPQNLASLTRNNDWKNRKNSFISMQTFKGWKHVDDLVRAIPHVSKNTRKLMAGGGIEHNYMTSVDKCKPQYFVSEEKDPDINPIHYGRKIWDVALEHGMEWLGYLRQERIRFLLRQSKVVIDPSWSVAYAKVGDHFNRVVVDGIIEGAIPIARNLGISTNEEGIGEVFKPYENYMMVPHDATPLEFAEKIEETCNLPDYLANEIHHANYTLLANFERERVAQQYVSLAFNMPTGVYGDLKVGEVSDKVKNKTEEVMSDFFKLSKQI
jgi:glycosyltransferase involved in cell wall biosynthesis